MTEKMIRNIFILSLIGYLTYTLKSVLTPFLIALFIAYLLNPFINLIQTKLKIKKRGFAVAIGIISTSLLTLLIILVSAPTINKEFHKAGILIKEYADFIPPIPNEIQEQLSNIIHSNYAKELINSNTINETFNKLSPLLINLFSESIDLLLGVFSLFLILIYLVFILQGYPKFSQTWLNWIPVHYRKNAEGISTDLNEGMRSYFRGQALIALIVGLLFCVGFSIIKLPLAILLGVLIGILNLVPYLQIIGFIPAFFLAVLHSLETGQSIWISLGATALVFAIIQLIQESILIPKIMNKVTGLHPAIILLSLSIWGSLLGLAGLILALPISTLLLSYYKRFINKEIN
jgi:predicted PurR-regulated permease PerM